jgi:hypothetical protein
LFLENCMNAFSSDQQRQGLGQPDPGLGAPKAIRGDRAGATVLQVVASKEKQNGTSGSRCRSVCYWPLPPGVFGVSDGLVGLVGIDGQPGGFVVLVFVGVGGVGLLVLLGGGGVFDDGGGVFDGGGVLVGVGVNVGVGVKVGVGLSSISDLSGSAKGSSATPLRAGSM